MSNSSTVELQTFQRILALAFAVQQGQLDNELLSEIVRAARWGGEDLDMVEASQADILRIVPAEGLSPTKVRLAEHQLPSSELDEDIQGSGAFLSYLARSLAECDIRTASEDVALTLALKDIAEEARVATNAAIAAVLLMRGEEIVCRATAGTSDPELDKLLNARTELCGECIRTKQPHVCSDAEADARIDLDACQRLGIRSWLTVPVLNHHELVGLFAICSPRPGAFADRDIESLESLCRQILIVNRAGQFSAATHKDEASRFDSHDHASTTSFQGGTTETKAARFQVRDSLLLTTIATILALVLGWMLGRISERMTLNEKKVPAQVSTKLDLHVQQTNETRRSQSGPLPASPSLDGSVAQRLTKTSTHAEKARKALPSGLSITVGQSATSKQKPGNDLLITDTATDPATQSSVGREPFSNSADSKGNPVEAIPVLGPESATSESVLVELLTPPETLPTLTAKTSQGATGGALEQQISLVYPPEALAKGVQGTVLLHAVVGEDGSLRDVKVVSGDPLLAAAATEAVSHWRYEPYQLNGKAIEAQTDIKVIFKLH